MKQAVRREDTAEAGDADVRRSPQQARSRQRVEMILDAAARLIGERGIDRVAMRDIAREVGTPLSAIYQYFPNKSAIVSMLHARITAETRQQTAAGLEGCATGDEFVAALEGLLDRYYVTVRSQPAVADIVHAVLADKALQHLDIADSRWHAETLIEAAAPLIRPGERAVFERSAFLFSHLVGGLMRLLLTLDEAEAAPLLDEYKRFARETLRRQLV